MRLRVKSSAHFAFMQDLTLISGSDLGDFLLNFVNVVSEMSGCYFVLFTQAFRGPLRTSVNNVFVKWLLIFYLKLTVLIWFGYS